MKIVGLMLVRNEDWVLRTSLAVALRWCDAVAVLMDRCDDFTEDIVKSYADKYPVIGATYDSLEGHWNEMDLRDHLHQAGRAIGGTHFALIDADEVPTNNYLPQLRGWMSQLAPGEVLDVPMVPVWDSLNTYRSDDSVWARAWLSLGVMDAPDLSWKPADDGYQHHNRAPHGFTGRMQRGTHGDGGVMHLQFAHKKRLLAKHVLYRMVDHIRWPGRDTVEHLNWKYDQALTAPGELSIIPQEWWGPQDRAGIHLLTQPYQDLEIKRLIARYGRHAFDGLDLKGY